MYKNLQIISRQLKKYDLPCEREYFFFVASSAYSMALAMEKNHEKLSEKVRDDYAAYRKLLKANLPVFLFSAHSCLKDKVLCILVMTRLLRPLYKVFYQDHL